MRMYLRKHFTLAGIVLGVVLTGCAPVGDPVEVVQTYLQARVASDVEKMTRLSCPAWETQAQVEATSFESMNAQLEGLTCAMQSQTDDQAVVSCQGKIITSYRGEQREWNLATQQFALTVNAGEWVMCGYAQTN